MPLPLAGADLAAYAALQTGSAVFDRSTQHHLEFTGPKAANALTGLVTNDVLGLRVGQGQYAAALTAKGRLIADMRIIRVADELFVTSAGDAAWTGWRDVVKKYVNPRLAKYAERSLHTLAIHGATANAHLLAVLDTLGVQPPPTLPSEPYASVHIALGEHALLLVRSPELGDVPGYDLLLPDELAERVRSAIALHVEIIIGTELAWEVARVEAARPHFGADMNDTTIPQEANLGDLGALSFDKGCYTGQETVARVHFRGHVNRHLRLLRSDEPLTVGTELRVDPDKVVGDVRSSVISPKLGPLAIAMVRREQNAGDTLRAVLPSGVELLAGVLR